MINKLLGDLYWAELPDLINQIMKGKPLYIQFPNSVMKKWNHYNPADRILRGVLYETDQYLCVEDPSQDIPLPVLIKNKKRLWTASLVTLWLSRNLPQVKLLLIRSIESMLDLRYDVVKDENFVRIRSELMKKNNLQELFQIYENLNHRSIPNRHTIDLNYFNGPHSFKICYYPLYKHSSNVYKRSPEDGV